MIGPVYVECPACEAEVEVPDDLLRCADPGCFADVHSFELVACECGRPLTVVAVGNLTNPSSVFLREERTLQ